MAYPVTAAGTARAATAAEPRIVVLPDHAALAATAADEVVRVLGAAVAERGSASLVLAGGSTPLSLYRLLADPPRSEAVDWAAVQVFWGDERAVPPDHPDSNFRAAHDELLSRVPLAAGSIHRIRGELPAEEAASEYEATLRAALGEPPALDLVLLGVGADGHTASLFPGDAAGEGRTAPGRRVAPAQAPEPPRSRITLTYEALAMAREVMFLVAGEAKAGIVARLLATPPTPAAAGLPAARVRPRSGRVAWLLDAAAASRLPERLR